ncbi:DegT/DnrJ/EryC1/StrS family aminotransferase [Streptomyces sp. HSG2]|uniref:DegT/DnrJ/EryC1/StrS family aminotransferase n=1 Tax=Streptomyces sp. HSG2 TaxID=2797167 RepID=UPI001906BB01|nr:DegT/DnrJ/EryC1/StrS family aminotransferase [Streptomyces sp. HSG2]
MSETLESERWAVSGPWSGSRPIERELAERFASFVGAEWCVPVDHGSSALVAGLHALGVGPGDEVIVPGLTWVASASVVARAGAVPVLVDIDPNTLCIEPQAVEAAITPATVAITAVHLYSAMANMDALRVIADRHGLALVEDAAQAYGASWRGAGAGSLGDFGAFSAQQGKTLTSGEGGLLVTSDDGLRAKAEMLRGDGRRYATGPQVRGRSDLEERSVVQGWNMHLTEIQAGLLLDGLERLPLQNRQRALFAEQLDKDLVAEGDLESIVPYGANDQRAYYHYAIRLREGAFAGLGATAVCEALSAELGYWVHPPYRPLDGHPLYDPRRFPGAGDGPLAERLNPSAYHLPAAHREAARTVLFHHPMLLGGDAHREAIVEAFAKVRRLAGQLRAAKTK